MNHTINIALCLLVLVGFAAGQNPFHKLMISEVTVGNTDGLEITNHGSLPVDMTGYQVHWWDSFGGTKVSAAMTNTIAAGATIIVSESGGSYPEANSTIVRLSIMPNLPTIASDAITVAIMDSGGSVIDEVRIADSAGTHPGDTFGGVFRGLAPGSPAANSIERIWGLDSDSGADWTRETVRSFGQMNRSSGPRGTDPIQVPDIRLNELDDSLDYIELFNPTASAVDLKDWFLLCASGNYGNHSHVRPFPASTVIPAGGYVVIGDGSTAPSELPVGTTYVDLGGVGSPGIPWSSVEFDCNLYTSLGQVVDVVRTTNATSKLVYNTHRAPAHWADFVGGARDLNAGAAAVGRGTTSADSDAGSDWYPIHDRTMGSSNTGYFVNESGHGHAFDVRLRDGRSDQSSTVIINCGPAAAGWVNHLFLDYQHSNGTGPFFGVGGDAISNWISLTGVPPFNGTLDMNGSTRWDFPPGAVPPGIDIDGIFYATDGANLVHTLVVIYDS